MGVISIKAKFGIDFSIANYVKFFDITKLFVIKLVVSAKPMPIRAIKRLSFFKKSINTMCLAIKENY